MNKNAIQKYAIWARNELIEQVKQRAYQYGISDKGYGDEYAQVVAGRVLTPGEKRQRQEFVGEIKRRGYQQAVEEVAYTWFNRFVALRFLEVNDYLPTHVRVFSDASGAVSPGGGLNPEILKDVLHLDLPGLDKAKVSELLNANATEELYRYLLLTQCNALNEALPEMFEQMGSYTEMLLPNNILKQDGVLGRLVADIPEEEWRLRTQKDISDIKAGLDEKGASVGQVEIIGWMYQYYNTEPKQAVFDGLKKNIKITKEKIPAATQLFTPDWIVRYMVENSLGRLWLENHPNSGLKANWKYYLDEAEQTPEVAEKLRVLRAQSPVKSPEDIRLIDPCMGSGHILAYAFDVLMQIYESEGYNPRDAAKLILEKNLHGLDIDRRAYQLAYFSLMMKARQYNRRIFTEGASPQVYYPNGNAELEELGSLLKVDKPIPMPEFSELISLFEPGYEEKMHVWNYKRLLSDKYDVVVTNPPYMGGSGMSAKMSEYVKDNYPDSKSDLFAVFIEKCGELLKPSGYQAMITQHAWLFLSSYEKLRGKLVHRDIVNMAHLGARAFEEIGGEVVQTTTFVLSQRNITDFEATYVRLVDYSSQQAKEEAFLAAKDRHTAKKENFEKIPGYPVAYWVSKSGINAFQAKPLNTLASPKQGLITGNVARFVRIWYEVDFSKVSVTNDTTRKWFPYSNGGEYRKWYGNNFDIVNWENDGFEVQNFVDENGKQRSRPQNRQFYFAEMGTWTAISSGDFSVRYYPEGGLFSNAGMAIFSNPELLKYLIALLNTKVVKYFLSVISETLNYNQGDIAKLPVRLSADKDIINLAERNIGLSRDDWDAFETSWGFKKHPLI
ncbi:MAG: BREX-1 system adenine-specific DNA-methyltransferase PglX [Christensenellaceae bacterium]|nr:BREX-1 system adenine-specific DNA-methyltransferase PglX [Christensenellaceae bacterium]